MDSYEKAVLDALKNGPKRRQWLVNELTSQIMSKRKLQKTLSELVTDGKLVKSSRTIEYGGRWETWYMLPKDRYLLDLDAGRITSVIERLKALILCMPTVDDVALELGITPTESERLLYQYAKLSGWYPPTETELVNARILLGESLVCATRMREGYVTENGESEHFDYLLYPDAPIILTNAKRFLGKNPDLLPTLSENGEKVTKWPASALRYLGGEYEPSNREIIGSAKHLFQPVVGLGPFINKR